VVNGDDDLCALAALNYPVIVKPNDEGSSKGIRQESLCADIHVAVSRCLWLRERYGCPALVEEFLPGTEITVGLRGNGREAAVIGAMEIAPANDVGTPFLYSVEIKRDFRRQVRYHVPPQISVADLHTLQSYALNAYRLLGCRDIARIDFRMDAHGRPHFLECNPLPGLNPESSDLVILARLVSDDAEHAYDHLVQGILEAAARRYGMRLPAAAH
jgi:D-alanine-D-alanine ligase